MTAFLLIVFSALLGACLVGFICWAAACAAAGREFDKLGLPGDIAQALHAELEARWHASLAGGGVAHGLQ